MCKGLHGAQHNALHTPHLCIQLRCRQFLHRLHLQRHVTLFSGSTLADHVSRRCHSATGRANTAAASFLSNNIRTVWSRIGVSRCAATYCMPKKRASKGMTLCCSEATRDAFDVRDAVGQRQGSAGRSWGRCGVHRAADSSTLGDSVTGEVRKFLELLPTCLRNTVTVWRRGECEHQT